MSRNKSSNVRWVKCAVNGATTISADGRKGVIRSLIIQRTTGSAIGTCAITNGEGTEILNLFHDSDESAQLDMWDMAYQGLVVTNSTAIEVWVGVIAEGEVSTIADMNQ